MNWSIFFKAVAAMFAIMSIANVYVWWMDIPHETLLPHRIDKAITQFFIALACWRFAVELFDEEP